MPMFVRLAGYLDVLAFPPKFVNADFKAGIFICIIRKKYPIIFKFVLITNVAQFSSKDFGFVVFRLT